MFFVASKLFWIILEPGNLLLILLVLGLLRMAATRRRKGMLLASFAGLVLVAITVLPLGQWAIAPLEMRFPAPQLPDRVDGIILLGGAVDPVLTLAHGQVALNEAGDRITETFILAKRYPDSRILLSGGNGTLLPAGMSEAKTTEDLLVEMGVDEHRLVIEDRSRNTYENAVFSKAVADPKTGETWILVTSAAHMPRAVGCFRHAGWEILPYPVDYQPNGRWRFDYLDLGGRLVLFARAAHEWLGLASYYLTGRIDTFFPGP
jgi:uncharacterized SAM-binding protein YcdF (DUF218 family)